MCHGQKVLLWRDCVPGVEGVPRGKLDPGRCLSEPPRGPGRKSRHNNTFWSRCSGSTKYIYSQKLFMVRLTRTYTQNHPPDPMTLARTNAIHSRTHNHLRRLPPFFPGPGRLPTSHEDMSDALASEALSRRRGLERRASECRNVSLSRRS